MPPPSGQPALPPVAQAARSRNFDPWNSPSTGHQRADTRPGTRWRESRSLKLRNQFLGGNAGGKRMSDTYGAGARDYNEKLGMIIPNDVRVRQKTSVVDMLVRPGAMKETLAAAVGDTPDAGSGLDGKTREQRLMEKRKEEDEAREQLKTQRRGIFDGVVVYVNGSTHPLISDHKLKQVLSENGARMSLHLGRRQVTHVVLGRPAGLGYGAGGGLAGGKLEKEIKRVSGCGVQYVGVEWILESLKAGRRLPEARFANLKIASKAQQSVYGMYLHRS